MRSGTLLRYLGESNMPFPVHTLLSFIASLRRENLIQLLGHQLYTEFAADPNGGQKA